SPFVVRCLHADVDRTPREYRAWRVPFFTVPIPDEGTGRGVTSSLWRPLKSPLKRDNPRSRSRDVFSGPLFRLNARQLHSNSKVLVPLFDLKFLTEFAAMFVGTSNRRH